ncbi:recombinase family protein [Glycomyces sp. MUSA5-2]|uniref:recombinase family protein n=1 Tax=Glycomyces sp. MUSA5-2 TaxID=2053002 RepID=UPI00300A74E6
MGTKPKTRRYSPKNDLSIKYRHLIWTPQQLAEAAPGSVTAIYVRRSPRPGEDDTLSLENQIINALKECETRGWVNVALFLDQSVSASNPRKPRPEYTRMVEALKSGVLARAVCRDSERLYRLPRELEDLIDLLDSKEFPIYLTHDSHFDLSNPGGRLNARIRVGINRSNVEEMAKKRNLTELERVRQGMPSTGRAKFGYAKTEDKTSYIIVPERAAAIRDAYAYILGMGGALAEVSRRWNAEGFTNTVGNPYDWDTVKAALLAPEVCGMRAYQRTTYLYDGAPEPVAPWLAELTPGNWEPIVTREEWEAMKAVLTRTLSAKGNHKRYLGSGLYQCGPVEECLPLRSHWASGHLYYVCRRECCGKQHTSVRADRIDAYVTELLMRYLRSPQQYEAFLASGQEDVAEVRAQAEAKAAKRAEIEGTQEKMGEMFFSGLISERAFLAGEARAKKELAELEEDGEADVEAKAPAVLTAVPWEQVLREWNDLDIEAQKNILAQVFPNIVVFPTGKTSKKPPIEEYVHVYDYRGRLLPLTVDEETQAVLLAQRAMAVQHGQRLLCEDEAAIDSAE